MSPSSVRESALQLRLVEDFRSSPNVPDVFWRSPPVVPVFPPCPRLGAGICFRPWPSPSSLRLYLPSVNASVRRDERKTDYQHRNERRFCLCGETVNAQNGPRKQQSISSIFIIFSVCLCRKSSDVSRASSGSAGAGEPHSSSFTNTRFLISRWLLKSVYVSGQLCACVLGVH